MVVWVIVLKKIIYFTSNGYKILSLVLSIIMISLTAILIVFCSQIWYAIFFSIWVVGVCLFSCFICFNHRIIIDLKHNKLKICNLRTVIINISEILDIYVDTKNSVDNYKYCFVIFMLRNGESVKLSGYSALYKHSAVAITKQKVEVLKELIK